MLVSGHGLCRRQRKGGSSVSRTTIARFGSIVMVLQMGEMQRAGTSTVMPEDEWWDIVELAGGKLDDLDEQVHD